MSTTGDANAPRGSVFSTNANSGVVSGLGEAAESKASPGTSPGIGHPDIFDDTGDGDMLGIIGDIPSIRHGSDPTSSDAHPAVLPNAADIIRRLENENAALSAYAARCEEELRQYQINSPEITEYIVKNLTNADGSGDKQPTPWREALETLNPLIVAYETRLVEANRLHKTAENSLVELKREFAALQRENVQLHREIKSIKQLAVSENKNTSAESKESGNNTNNITNKTNNKPSSSIPTPTPPSLDPSLLVEAGGLTDDRNELLLQLNLQKQKMELLAQSELAARKELSRLPEREALQRSLEDAGQVISIQKKQILSLESTVSRLKSSNTTLNKEVSILQEKLTDMDVSGIRYAELSQSHRALQNKLNQLEKEKNSLQNSLESASKRESSLREELAGNEKDMVGLLETLSSLENTINAAKNRENELTARESTAINKMEIAEVNAAKCQKQIEILQKENENLRIKIAETATEMKEACEKDIEGLLKKAREKESELLKDIENYEKKLITMQLQLEQLQRQLVTSQEQAQKVSTVCEDELTKTVTELHQTQTKLAELNSKIINYENKINRLKGDVIAAEKMASTAHEGSLSQIQNLKTQNNHLKTALETANGRLAQLELYCKEQEQTYAERLQITEDDLNLLKLELENEKKARMVSEEDLKARLDEAYSVHEKSTKKAEKIIKRQEELSQKWREQQKVALTKLQSLLTESYMKNDENNNKISSLQTSYQSAVVERDGLSALLAQEEEARRALVKENIELERRYREIQGQLLTAQSNEQSLTSANAELVLKNDELLLENKKLKRKINSLSIKISALGGEDTSEHYLFIRSNDDVSTPNRSRLHISSRGAG